MGALVQKRFPDFINQFFDDWSDSTENTRDLKHFPDVQIEQNENGYRLVVPIPGALKDTLKVKVEDNQLKISGEYKTHTKEDYKLVHRDYRTWSSFERSLRIDENKFDIDSVNAELNDGILEVTLPLKPEERKKQYEIEVK